MGKKAIWGLIGIMLSASLAAAAEHAAGGEGLERPEVLIWKGINIAIVVGALIYFFKEPFLKWIQEYKESIAKSLTEAEENYRQAKEELERAKKALEEAKVKYEESLKTAQELAQHERERMIKEAQEIAEHIRKKAQKIIELETEKAKEELRKYAAQKAIQLSEKMLKELFSDPEIQKRFTERMISELSKN